MILGCFGAKTYLYRLKFISMKKTLLSFVFIFSVVFSFGQSLADSVQNFEVITMEQDTFNLNEFWQENPEKKVAIEFFFVDSPLCKEVSPMISESFKNFGCNEHDVFYLSINVSDDSASVAHYRDTLNIETPIVLSSMGGDLVDELCEIHAYPTLVLLQKETFIPENDTIWIYDEETEVNIVDSIIIYDEEDRTNFLEKDIWPITEVESLDSIIASHGINKNTCSEDQNNSTGIDKEEIFSHLFKLFPNPNAGRFFITSAKLDGNFEIEIMDLSGKTLIKQHERFTRNIPCQIQVYDLSKGIYILRIRNQKEFWSEKLIVQ